MLGQAFADSLNQHALRRQLIQHPFFDHVRSAELSKEQVAMFLGQWWHPLHYFPDFLSRLIAATPRIEIRTAISKILFQELGEGDVKRAHEVIYIDTMVPLGFTEAAVSGAAPFEATKALVAAYAEHAKEMLSGLGFLYGTEVADLAMVSGIGSAVRRVTGAKHLEWVEIHVQQEPEHVARANDAVGLDFPAAEEKAILQGAETMWKHWIAFFDELDRRIFARTPAALHG